MLQYHGTHAAGADGLERTPLTTIDKTRQFGELKFSGVSADLLPGSEDPEICARLLDAGRIMLALPLLLFSFYLIPGLMGASLGIWDSWLPPKMQTDVSVVNSISAFRGAGEMEGSEAAVVSTHSVQKLFLPI